VEQRLIVERQTVSVDVWQPRVTLALLACDFCLFGLIVGAHGVLWAELVAALSLSKSVFGAVQLASPLLSVVLLLAGGPLVWWAGKKRLALVSLALLAGSNLALAGASGLLGLAAALLLAGGGNGLLEMSMNGATLDWEQQTGRSVMNLMHAGFSGGAVVGAFAAGTLLGQGWSYSQVLALIVLLCILALLGTLPIRYPPSEAARSAADAPSPTLWLLFRQRALLTLAILCVLGIVGESVANIWSVIYLHELGAKAFVGGAAFALFNSAMFIGRLGNSWLVGRQGARFSLLLSGVLMVLSSVLLLLPGVAVAVAAFVLLGLAVAGVVPTVLSAAARLWPSSSAAITGGIIAAAYTGFIICPPLTGWIADLVSLRIALVAAGLSGLGVLWLARRVK
jgi:fucose permease